MTTRTQIIEGLKNIGLQHSVYCDQEMNSDAPCDCSAKEGNAAIDAAIAEVADD